VTSYFDFCVVFWAILGVFYDVLWYMILFLCFYDPVFVFLWCDLWSLWCILWCGWRRDPFFVCFSVIRRFPRVQFPPINSSCASFYMVHLSLCYDVFQVFFMMCLMSCVIFCVFSFDFKWFLSLFWSLSWAQLKQLMLMEMKVFYVFYHFVMCFYDTMWYDVFYDILWYDVLARFWISKSHGTPGSICVWMRLKLKPKGDTLCEVTFNEVYINHKTHHKYHKTHHIINMITIIKCVLEYEFLA